MLHSHVSTYFRGEAAIVEVRNKLASITGAEELHQIIRWLLNTGHKRIWLDFEESPRVSRDGIGDLIGLYIDIIRAGGEMRLLNLDNEAAEFLACIPLPVVEKGGCTDVALSRGSRHLCRRRGPIWIGNQTRS